MSHMQRPAQRLMSALLGALVTSALALGCDKQPAPPVPPAPAPPPQVVNPPPPPPPIPQPAPLPPAVQKPRPGIHKLGGGMAVDFRKDGLVTLKGKNQWGEMLNQTYESAAYFKAAIPVLSRSLTPPQAAALAKLDAGLKLAAAQ